MGKPGLAFDFQVSRKLVTCYIKRFSCPKVLSTNLRESQEYPLNQTLQVNGWKYLTKIKFFRFPNVIQKGSEEWNREQVFIWCVKKKKKKKKKQSIATTQKGQTQISLSGCCLITGKTVAWEGEIVQVLTMPPAHFLTTRYRCWKSECRKHGPRQMKGNKSYFSKINQA